MATNTVISKETAKRLIKDIKQIQSDPIEGIYYIHDDKDMLKGKALIMGPENTPYEGGYYLFKFVFPTDFPFSPPKVSYHTNDGITRMHPNLYKNGKVCLSVLNTWNGEAWTSCQTITSVLLVLQSILTTNPLLHEPGIDVSHRDFHRYTEIIRYKNIETSIMDVLTKTHYTLEFGELIDIAKKDFGEHFEKKQCILKTSEELYKKSSIYTESGDTYVSIYNIRCSIQYKRLTNKFYVLSKIKRNRS